MTSMNRCRDAEPRLDPRAGTDAAEPNWPGLAMMAVGLTMATLAVIAASTDAHGQTQPQIPAPVPAPALPADAGWSARHLGPGAAISIGGGIAVAPVYEGGEKFKVSPVPLIEVTGLFNNRVFLSSVRGAGVNILKDGPLKLGVSVGYSAGRDSGDDSNLKGMTDIDGAATVSGFLRYDLKPLSFDVRVTNRLGDASGTQARFGAQYHVSPLAGLTLSAGPSLTWADQSYTNHFFGITAAEATRARAQGNPLSAYRAGSGLKDVSFSLDGTYQLSPSWSLRASLGIAKLLGDAGDSPLVKKDVTPRFLVGTSYRF